MMQQQQQQFFLMMASGCSGNRAILPSTSQLFPTGTTKMIDYRPEEQATTNSPDVIIEQGQREENPSTSKVTDELDLSDNVVGNKRKRHSSGASEEPCTRQLRSRVRLGTIPASVEKPCNIFLKNDELIKELNEISPDMKVQDLDEKKRLRAEAENLLEEIKKDDCKDHISKLANGIIVAVERSGLGPYALFQDLQHTLLDIIDDLSGLCGAYLKYQVLLPEAIIFGYCKLKGCEYSVGVKMFEASSKLIAE